MQTQWRASKKGEAKDNRSRAAGGLEGAVPPMAGVWVFRNGVFSLVRNPKREAALEQSKGGYRAAGEAWAPPRKMLVYRATNEVISSYEALENKLFELGWERCPSRDPLLRQYYRRENGPYLLTLPTVEFQSLKPIHLYDIVVQSRTAFEVRDILDRYS